MGHRSRATSASVCSIGGSFAIDHQSVSQFNRGPAAQPLNPLFCVYLWYTTFTITKGREAFQLVPCIAELPDICRLKNYFTLL